MLEVRELQQSDIKLLLDYWYSRTPHQLEIMGADPKKMPSRESFEKKISQQLTQTYFKKQAYATIWLQDGQPIGHNNINRIFFGEEAVMHLHVWDSAHRQKGLGFNLLKKSIPLFFKHFELKTLICEPYSENLAPNKTLKKLGFSFKKKYKTIPGFINFEQFVNRYELSQEDFANKKWSI